MLYFYGTYFIFLSVWKMYYFLIWVHCAEPLRKRAQFLKVVTLRMSVH